MNPFQEAVAALAAVSIHAEIERSESGQLQITLGGEAVESWSDSDGPYVIVAVSEGADAGLRDPRA